MAQKCKPNLLGRLLKVEQQKKTKKLKNVKEVGFYHLGFTFETLKASKLAIRKPWPLQGATRVQSFSIALVATMSQMATISEALPEKKSAQATVSKIVIASLHTVPTNWRATPAPTREW